MVVSRSVVAGVVVVMPHLEPSQAFAAIEVACHTIVVGPAAIVAKACPVVIVRAPIGEIGGVGILPHVPVAIALGVVVGAHAVLLGLPELVTQAGALAMTAAGLIMVGGVGAQDGSLGRVNAVAWAAVLSVGSSGSAVGEPHHLLVPALPVRTGATPGIIIIGDVAVGVVGDHLSFG